MRLRTSSVLLLLAITLGAREVAGAEAPAADAPPAGQQPPRTSSSFKPNGEVQFNWATRSLGDPLPFDVPFYLVAKEVDEKIVSLSGRYISSKRAGCGGAFPTVELSVDYGSGDRALVRTERRQIGLLYPWERGRQTEKPRLHVTEPLLPNRYTCFELTRRRRPETTDAQLQEKLQSAVDAAMRRADPNLTESYVPQEVYDDLRQELIDAIESQLGASEQVVWGEDSFLNPAATTVSLPVASQRSFDALIEAQNRRAKAIKNLERGIDSTASLLSRVLGSPELAAVRAAASSVDMPEELEPVFAGRESLFQVQFGDSRASVEALAAGNAALVDGTPTQTSLRDSWKPQDLAQRKQNLTSTRQSLADLYNVARLLSRDEKLREAAKVESDLSGLSSALKRALANLEGVQALTRILEQRLQTRVELRQELTADITTEIVETLSFEGSTSASYDTLANWYTGLDFGIALAQDIEDLFGYTGVNIYFRPVNKQAPLGSFANGFRSALLKRLSVTLGLAFQGLQREPGTALEGPSQQSLGLIGDQPLLVGAGFRISRALRLSGGALVFKEENPDPLVTGKELVWSPYLSLSVDWDFNSTLKNRFAKPVD